MILSRLLPLAAATLLILTTAACATADRPEPQETAPPTASPSTPAPGAAEDGGPEDPSTEHPSEDLVLTIEGVGDLLLGKPPTDSEMVEFDPDHCYDETIDMGRIDPTDGRWTWKATEESGLPPVRLAALTGTVAVIEVGSATIPTDRGLRIGDSMARFASLYPDAQAGRATQLSSIHTVTDGDRSMIFEVTTPGYDLAPDSADRVVSMMVALDAHVSILAPRVSTDYVIGGCL